MLRLWSELMLKSEAHLPMGTQHTCGCHRICGWKGPCAVTTQMWKLGLEVVCPSHCHKACAQDWRDGSEVKSTDCSSGGPEFNSQQPHGGSQLSIWDVAPSSDMQAEHCIA